MKNFSIIDVFKEIGIDAYKIAIDYKILGLLVTSTAILDIIGSYIQTYVYADWKYLGFLITVIILDILSKFYQLAEKDGVFSLREFVNKSFLKILKYAILLILSHVLSEYTIVGERNSFFSWLPNVLLSIPMVLEAESIVSNLGYELSGKWSDVVSTIKSVLKPKNKEQ